MTQYLEKLSTNIYVLWSAILAAATGAWFTCAFLGDISHQIYNNRQEDVAYRTLNDYKLQELKDGQLDTKLWMRNISSKIDGHTLDIDELKTEIQQQDKK